VLKGTVTVLFHRLESDGIVHTYEIKANSLSSLVVNAGDSSAVLLGNAVIRDVTNPLAPVLVDGTAILQVVIDDNGSPSGNDTIEITAWKLDGSLWFAAAWDGTLSVPQNLAGGNLTVH
jgi:hypothetical protein